MGSSALRFSKLISTNYRSWAVNMRLYPESIEFFEFTGGSVVSPAADPSENVGLKFASRAKEASMYICLAVETEQQIHVCDTTSANSAWDALKD